MSELRALDAALAAHERALTRAAAESLDTWSARVLAASRAQVPVDSGDLRESGYAEVVETDTGAVAQLGYDTPYALRQHEDLSLPHPNGGTSKFLETALAEHADELGGLVIGELRAVR